MIYIYDIVVFETAKGQYEVLQETYQLDLIY